MPIKTWFVLGLILLLNTHTLGQVQEKPIVVAPSIGDTLDLSERDYYQLFPNMVGFQSAVFYLNTDSSLTVRVALIQNDMKRDTVLERYRSLAEVRRDIERLSNVNKTAKLSGWSKGTAFSNARVELMSGAILDGAKVTFAGDSVVLASSSVQEPKTVALGDVSRVETVRGNHLVVGAFVGAAVGIAATFIIKSNYEEPETTHESGSGPGYTWTQTTTVTKEFPPEYGVAIVGAGLGLGMLIGSSIKGWEVIYPQDEARLRVSLNCRPSKGSYATPVLSVRFAL